MSTFGVGQATPFSDADDYNAFAFMFDRKMDDIQTMTLVEVQAVNTTALTVDVLVLVNIITGANAPVEHEVIYGRPYLRTQGGTSGIICDPVAGDIGAMVFASRDLSAVIASKGAANPGSFRRFAWSDGVYVGATLNEPPTQFIQFLGGSVSVQSPMLQTSGNVSVGTGYTGTFTTSTGDVVTVQNGIITNVD